MRRILRIDGGSTARRDVEREIALHLELRAKEFEAAGMSPEAARAAALAAFGDRTEVEAEVRGIHDGTVQRRRWREWLGELRQDLRIGGRMLRRSPAFTIVAVLTLAIGIGANTAIFSVFRSVLMRPLPYSRPEQLVQVWSDHRALGRAEPEWLTPPDYVDLRDGNRTFSAIAAYQGWGPDITGDGDPESLGGLMVSGNYFSMLGASAAAGRLILPTDDDASAPPVVVLSHAFWSRRFGADRTVIGKRITLSGNPWMVVGVLAPDFRAPIQSVAPDVFRPIRRPSNSGCGRGCIVVRAIGRMKPGVTPAAAQADLAVIAARLARDYPETNARVGSWIVPLHEQITGSSKASLITLAIAVGLVLLIGCVNLANLLLVRSATRDRELGVRAALGAGRGRMLRQLLTENVLLAAIGGALGLALGIVGSRLLAALVPDSVRRVQDISVDGGVLVFAVGITLVAAVLFGVLPAVHAVHASLSRSARGGRTDGGRQGALTRSTLVVTQLALAVMLLVGSGLLLRSFLLMQRVDLGYRADGVMMTNVFFPATRYEAGADALRAIDDLLTRLRAQRSIASAEATDLPVLAGGDQDINAIPIGEPDDAKRPPSIWYRAVTAGYLSEMRMRLVSGRQFTARDRRGAPNVAILNQEAADRYFGGRSPVGREMAMGKRDGAPRVAIIGVVASARHDGPQQPYKPEMFVPIAQFPSRGVTVVIEPSRGAIPAGQAFAETLREVDPLIPVSTIQPIESALGDAVALPRLFATLVGIFALASLLLAALGVYGVMAYAVTQRQREIGVRIALGAAPRGIGLLILGQSTRLAALGLVIGVGASLLLGRLLAKLLFGVTPFDVPTLVTVPIVLGVVTLVASWVPARRAMRLDPVSVIRS